MPSAAMREYQMPSMSKMSGRMITAADWNKSVLKKDMIAETSPLLRAVKNDEPYMAIPENKIPRVYANTGIELNMIKDFVFKKAESDERFKIITHSITIRITIIVIVSSWVNCPTEFHIVFVSFFT